VIGEAGSGGWTMLSRNWIPSQRAVAAASRYQELREVLVEVNEEAVKILTGLSLEVPTRFLSLTFLCWHRMTLLRGCCRPVRSAGRITDQSMKIANYCNEYVHQGKPIQRKAKEEGQEENRGQYEYKQPSSSVYSYKSTS
jgi:hypothetical protein